MTPPKHPRRDAATVAVMRLADEAADKLIRERHKRLSGRDAEYARQLAKNPEGNNRNKGSAPVGRIGLKGNRGRQNHSGTRRTKPAY